MNQKVFRSLTSLMLALASALAGFSPALAAPPANDNFLDAALITLLPFSATIDMTEAGIEPDETQYSCTNVEHSVWYSFIPIENITVRLSMTGSGVSNALGSILRADGSGISGLTILRCAYAVNPPVEVQLNAGQTYYLQASTYAGEVGTIQINMEQIPPPANNNFIDTEQIGSLPFSATVDLTAASIEPSEPQPCYFMDRSVWYSFTPMQDMIIQADTQGSTFNNTNVSVYRSTGTGITELEFLGCSIFSLGTATFTAEAGQIYYIQAGNAFGDVGTIQLNLQQLLPPPNDNFADAEAITALPYSTSVDISAAGIESGEPQPCSNWGKSVWYSFIPTQTMNVRIDTTFNVNVYSSNGPGFENLGFQGCTYQNNGRFSFLAEAGQKYYLQVEGPANIQITIEQIIPPANDNFMDAEAIPSLPFNTTVNVTDASLEAGEPLACPYSQKTAWYSFTPSESMIIRVTNNYNLTVYRADGLGFENLVFQGCNSNNGSVNFFAEAGQKYYLQVDGFGSIDITLEQIPPPTNDNFANATVIPAPLPFDDTIDTLAASLEDGEPRPSCAYIDPGTARSVWYAFTPTTTGAVSASIPTAAFTPVFAAYTGNSLDSLTQVGCQIYSGNLLTLIMNAGTTYYFQVGNLYPWEQGGSMQFHLDVAPLPVANFSFNPSDPSKYDTIQFYDGSYDPANIGIDTWEWNFGDGTLASSFSPTHKFATDGDYPVTLTVTTVDGRTASITQTVQVRTHDVTIMKVTAPTSANSGQTRTIIVSVRNLAYPETVRVDLYKSVPGGEVWIGTLTLQVPVSSGNKTTPFTFNYTFTSQDAQLGKVTFRAVATIESARDAFPQDNVKISSQTRVAR